MRIVHPVAACFTAACLFFGCRSVAAENWTRFRGENGQGVSSETNLPLNWSKTENVNWKTAIPGEGWSSPIVYEDRVFVTTASEEGASCRVLAIDREEGKVLWDREVHRQDPGPKRGESRVGHVTPIVVDGGDQIISAGGDRVQGFDVASGERLWSVYSQGEGVTPSPVVGDGVLFTSSGFEAPTILAIRLGERGDVTDTHIVWEQQRGVPALASPLLASPYLYTISRENILHCMEQATGEIVWQKRLSEDYWASPVYADGRIYLLSEDGVTLVLKPGDKYEEITRNSLDEKCLASMAVSDGQFFYSGSRSFVLHRRAGTPPMKVTSGVFESPSFVRGALSGFSGCLASNQLPSAFSTDSNHRRPRWLGSGLSICMHR